MSKRTDPNRRTITSMMNSIQKRIAQLSFHGKQYESEIDALKKKWNALALERKGLKQINS